MQRLEVAEGAVGRERSTHTGFSGHRHRSVTAHTENALSKLLRHLSPKEKPDVLRVLFGHSVTVGLGMTNVLQK